MDKENILLKIDQLIQDKLNTIKDKVKENINGKMAVYMMVLGEMTEWKEQEFLLTCQMYLQELLRITIFIKMVNLLIHLLQKVNIKIFFYSRKNNKCLEKLLITKIFLYLNVIMILKKCTRLYIKLINIIELH